MTANAHRRPLNVSFRRGSSAEQVFRKRAGLPSTEAIALGEKPTPSHDLHFHGGKTIADLNFVNFYVGGDTWGASDISNIDKSLEAAMSDKNLNNVMEQYFPTSISSTFMGSQKLAGTAPATFSQGDVESLVAAMAEQGKFEGRDLTSTVFNFMLPRGTVLNDNAGPSADSKPEVKVEKKSPIPHDDEADSLHGLGGYHGSIHTNNGDTIYYAIGVYSEKLANGSENGIAIFDQPWKNVVATFYHELNEARTDCDVEDAIRAGNDPSAVKFLGWTSKQGEECGDFPVFENGNALSKVFQEVQLSSGGGTVPVQFQYSVSVHGPEGPQAMPVKKANSNAHH
jgi:hypothetical protein